MSDNVTLTFPDEEIDLTHQPEYDFKVLRFHYEDDPIALSLIAEIERLGALVGYHQRVSEDDRRSRDHWYGAAEAAMKERDKWLQQLMEMREREAKWKAIIEEVARDTGKFYGPPQDNRPPAVASSSPYITDEVTLSMTEDAMTAFRKWVEKVEKGALIGGFKGRSKNRTRK